jgi:pimeloyl-ACP methyl ester carboxylesterase
MPFADNKGVKIHYQMVGDGPAVLLQHGYTTSLNRWNEFGYVEALKKNFRLVLIDARGHGQSDKPHKASDYDWKVRTNDILAVADSLELEQFHFWGYSMGGIYGYNLANVAPHRLHSLVIGGADPYATSFSAFDGIDGGDDEKFVEAMENLLNERFNKETCRRMLANDLKAMAAAAVDRPSLEQEMRNSDLFCLLYVGDEDDRFQRVKQFAETMPSAEFVSISGQNHAQTNARSDLVLPHVLEFLSRF